MNTHFSHAPSRTFKKVAQLLNIRLSARSYIMSTSLRLLFVGIFAGAVALLLIGGSTIGIAHQEQDRMIEKLSFPNEPVKIIIVKTKKGAVNVGENLKMRPTG